MTESYGLLLVCSLGLNAVWTLIYLFLLRRRNATPRLSTKRFNKLQATYAIHQVGCRCQYCHEFSKSIDQRFL